MGFSVSGSFALMAIATFIALGMAFTAGSNAIERVSSAQDETWEDHLEQQNTDIEIANATYNGSGTNTLAVEINNTGSSTLSVNDTDVIVDNELRTTFDARTVDGDTTTDLWFPGETLRIEISEPSAPDRVKIVTGPGVARTTGVS